MSIVLLAVVLLAWTIYVSLHVVMPIAMGRLRRSEARETDLPFVSVLVTARNEERDLPRCIEALGLLDYPEDRIEILLADDRSTDQTGRIIQAAAARDRRFVALTTPSDAPLSGKARGIAFAARRAQGEWLFITDADCAVRPGWIKHMLSRADADAGLLGGLLVIEPDGFVGTIESSVTAYLQPFAMGLAGLGVRPIVSGPNMAIRRKTYLDAGGLEARQFHVSEDLALTMMVADAGQGVIVHADHETTVRVRPVPSLRHLLSQHRRWLLGARDEPSVFWPVYLLLGTQAVLFLGLDVLIVVAPMLGIGLWLIAALSNAFANAMLGRRLGEQLVRLLPAQQLYFALGWPLVFASTLVSRRIRWLGDGFVVVFGDRASSSSSAQ